FDSLPIQIYTAYLRTNRFTLDLFLILYNYSKVESEIFETSDLSKFDLEQLYQTPIPSPPITLPLLLLNNNNMTLQAQDINNLINTIQALNNWIQNQTNAVANNTNHLGQRETKLIKIILFAGGNQDPVTWIKEFEFCKFTTSLRTELQMGVYLFGENTWDEVVNRAKTCELTHYSAAIYITSNLNNNIVTPTPTSSNSVKIIMEALTKLSVNTEGSDASEDNTNPFIIYLKKEDKNNINEAYVGKRRKVVEEIKL
ncbi:6514_t:CDS:2, partial [Racocetra fulgida]